MKIINSKTLFLLISGRRLVYLIILSACLFIPALSLSAEEKSEYRHILLLGAEQPVSNSEFKTPSPLLVYYYIRDDLDDDNYFQFTLRTTRAFFILGEKNEKYFAGIKPLVNHTIYSAYHSFADGVNDDSRCFRGNNAGAEFFYEYSPVRYFKAGINYYPGYYWYQDKQKNDTMFFRQEATEINLPENHWEHTGELNFTIDKLEQKDINRIKHGFIIEGTYNYIYRSGYGTFYDTASAENSSIDKTQKRYLSAGLYYNFNYDINLLLDIAGGYHTNIDRNNSDQIGSFIADKGVMPGYFWGEFYHNKFCIIRTQAGLPLFYWNARIQPGFNVMYMTGDNDVVGV